MPNRSIISICPHCGDEARGYLFLTPDGHTIRSYWCREHGDVVPRGNDDDDDKEHSSLPDVQDGIPTASAMVERGRLEVETGFHVLQKAKWIGPPAGLKRATI